MYRYLTGHCSELSHAELSIRDPQVRRKGLWLYTPEDHNIQAFGSIVLKCEQADLASLEETPKKIGLVCPSKQFNGLLKNFKKIGARKVRHVASADKFTYGHWKATKHWYIIEKDELWIIRDVFDQEPWSKIDYQLPYRDLRRGIINFKLARSLISLAQSDSIWDPFAGQGRVAIAGSEILSTITLSDIDAKVIAEATENYQFAKETLKLPKLESYFEYDTRSPELMHSSLPETVVTEGYLGRTFSYPPTHQEAEQQFKNVYSMWEGILPNWHTLGVAKAVVCLPWYPKLRLRPDAFKLLALKHNYILEPSIPQPILYTRPKSNTGHAIFILKKK